MAFLAFRWRANDGLTLNAGLEAANFQVIRSCIASKPYIFVIFFQGGPDPLSPLWIGTCSSTAHGCQVHVSVSCNVSSQPIQELLGFCYKKCGTEC